MNINLDFSVTGPGDSCYLGYMCSLTVTFFCENLTQYISIIGLVSAEKPLMKTIIPPLC